MHLRAHLRKRDVLTADQISNTKRNAVCRTLRPAKIKGWGAALLSGCFDTEKHRPGSAPVFTSVNFCFFNYRQSLQEPTKRRAKDFLPMVLDNCAVSHDYLVKIPIKYPFQAMCAFVVDP
jgi:hypothetical protein